MIAKTLYPILKIALNTLKNCLAVLTSLKISSSMTCARANNELVPGKGCAPIRGGSARKGYHLQAPDI